MSKTAPIDQSREPGAKAAENTIPLSVPYLHGHEIEYIKECFDTGWVSSVGPYVNRFESMAAQRMGAKHAVAVVNGTAALHVSLLVAGIGPGDEVVMPTLTFIAPANAIRYVGAWPVFVDVDADYWQMDPQRVADFLQKDCVSRKNGLVNKRTGRRVRALLPVHVLGHPCDMDALRFLGRKHDLLIIEDATESLGSMYKNKPAGHLGDISCLSFNGNKILTCGGGGMVVTDKGPWAKKIKYLTTQAKDDPLEYVHNEIGFNYRLTNIQAAMGVAQLEKLDFHVSEKRRIADAYRHAFADHPGLSFMKQAPWAYSNHWLSTICIDQRRFGMGSRSLLHQLEINGVQSRPLWQPLHKSLSQKGATSTPCPVAEKLYKEALSLPCSVGLTPSDQQRVIDLVLSAASSSREAP